jgi:hypothetical protein
MPSPLHRDIPCVNLVDFKIAVNDGTWKTFLQNTIIGGQDEVLSSAMIRHLSLSQKPSIYRRYPAFLAGRIPAVPAVNLVCPFHPNPKVSSPQMPFEDMRIIYAIFAGSVIMEGSGKI